MPVVPVVPVAVMLVPLPLPEVSCTVVDEVALLAVVLLAVVLLAVGPVTLPDWVSELPSLPPVDPLQATKNDKMRGAEK